jgi:hypothetical protein
MLYHKFSKNACLEIILRSSVHRDITKILVFCVYDYEYFTW